MKGHVCTQAKCLIQQEHIVVSLIWSDLEYYYSSLDGMIVHLRLPPPPPSILSSFTDNLPVHIYTPGSTEATVRVECLAQEQGLEPWPLELESSTLSIKPPLLPLGKRKTVPQIVTEWQLTFLKWFFLCSTRIMRIQHFPGIFEL